MDDEFEDVAWRRSRTLGELLLGHSHHPSDCGGASTDCTCSVNLHSPISFLLTFTDLTYTVKNPRKMPLSSILSRNRPNDVELRGNRTLLDSISGEAREGEILAILGASGSGKSTLIDALANRIARTSLKGTVALNGAPLESRLLKSISAYVMQDDLLFPMLTVEETLMFAGDFRLPRSLPASAKKARINALIDQLGLRSACKTIIGDEGHRGVSGGERRRVSIGTNIIHDPIILFLDEPTSGLDSTSAFMVLKVLKRIALSGSIVVMSIHQPSSRIITLLDRLLVLSRGRTIFNGAPDTLPLFFSNAGYHIPESESRTELALDLIHDLESTTAGTEVLANLNRSSHFTIDNPDVNRVSSAESLKQAISSRGKLVSGSTFANPIWVEMEVLARRSLLNSRRQPEVIGVMIVTMMVTGFFLATIFWQLQSSPKGVKERLGFFMFVTTTMFYTCANGLLVFIQERYILTRETAYNAYRHSSYVLASSAVGLPPLILASIAFALATFFAVGLAGGASGFMFFCFVILAALWAGSGFVTFLSAVVPHVMLGYMASVAILSYFMLFAGLFIERDRIPDYWIWFHYISLMKYPYEAVLQNEFGGEGKCFVRGVQMFDGTELAEAGVGVKERLLGAISGAVGVEVTAETCVLTGREILEKYGISQLSKWECLWVTVAWGFLFRVLVLCCIAVG